MMRTWPLAAAALMGGCGKGLPVDRPLTVTEVIDNIHTLNGKRVSARGYLGTCAGYDCELFVSRADRDKWWDDFVKASRGEHYETRDIAYLSVGSAVDFDRKATPLQNRKVIITGTVDNHCRSGFFGFFKRNHCTDRAEDIRATDIIALKEI